MSLPSVSNAMTTYHCIQKSELSRSQDHFRTLHWTSAHIMLGESSSSLLTTTQIGPTSFTTQLPLLLKAFWSNTPRRKSLPRCSSDSNTLPHSHCTHRTTGKGRPQSNPYPSSMESMTENSLRGLVPYLNTLSLRH